VSELGVRTSAGRPPDSHALRGHGGHRTPPRPATSNQTTPPHGAMQRGRRRRGKSGGPPRPREQIRLPQTRVSAGKLPGEFVLSDVEPFSFHPDKTLPGTLHHSGNRPAPPSDHTPLARRSAFQRAWKRSRRGNLDVPAGLKRLQRENFCRARSRRGYLRAHGAAELCDSTPVIAEGSGRFP